MKATMVLCALLVAAGVSAQSLVGTWVSPEPILMNIKFSMTFSDEDYLIDCSLGQTIGTWYQAGSQIHFTPTKIGINAGDVGKSDVWDYRFIDDDTFTMKSGAVEVRMIRKK